MRPVCSVGEHPILWGEYQASVEEKENGLERRREIQ